MATTSIPHRWKYDVFVSFRGEDIRKNFMDHMFNDFKQKGIQAFRDDRELPKGEEISPHLYKAIEESRFLIVIFSKNYASSTWCLRELVKILECKQIEDPKHEVRIIFYDAKPDVVRKQKGSYAKAFAKHDVSNRTEVDKWREALSNAANLSGWDLLDLTNGYESKFIDYISKEILNKLCDGGPLHIGDYLVGIDFHFDKLEMSRFVGSDKVNMIGICGISGIGKTTLAKAIYNLMYVHFEGSCFCEDVKDQQDLTQVQMQLIDDIMKTRAPKISNVGQGIMVIKKLMSSKPILLVLDDVDHRDQLKALAGSTSWFCPGSLIIFTGKDKQLLNSHRVDEIHDMDFLDEEESLKLFSFHALEEKHPSAGFQELVEKAVNYVQGHPLALIVLGCFLYGKTMSEWVSELERLREHPNEEIHQVLRLSYDGLNLEQQNILLDIACLFVGENSDFVASILDGCNFFADRNMRVLVDKSLIRISSDMSLQMHDLIQAMAREIIHEESIMTGKQSRLWHSSEVYNVLSEKKVPIIEAVEVLVLSLEKFSQKVQIDANDFAHLKKLRILKIYQEEKVSERKRELKGHNVIFSGENLDYLSNKLSLFYWHGCPFECLPSDFYPENIVAIDLSYSNIKHIWTTPKCFKRLKVMKLRYCCNLTTTPDFSEIRNLEELDLEGCVNLVIVHPSIGMLNKLAILNLKGCTRVGSFPEAFWSRCWTSISGFIWNQQHPQRSVSLAGLHMLKKLNLSYCNLVQVPDGIGGLPCLKKLNLDGNNFTSLPGSLSQLSNLQKLTLNGCKKLEVLPELPHSLKDLSASNCTSLCSITGSNPIMSGRYTYLKKCPKLFKVSISETQCLDSSVTSQGSRFSSFLRYADNRCELFHLPGSSIEELNMFYEGNSIPNWFTNKSLGNQVKVELPSDWSFSKLRGYGICVVFKRKTPYTDFTDFGYSVKNFDGAYLGGRNLYSSVYYWEYCSEKPIRIDESDMIWLHYTTSEIQKQKLEEAKNFVTFCFNDEGEDEDEDDDEDDEDDDEDEDEDEDEGEDEDDEDEDEGEDEDEDEDEDDEGEGIEVKECGVRLVWDEDLDQEAGDLIMFQDFPTLSQHGGALCVFEKYGYIKWTW